MAKITVILPVHNGANYLESSIRSVLGQSFEDFVLHVLDDGSSDSSAKIAKSTGDSRVRYSYSERNGLFKTLNRGFALAESPLVRIWAHDDLMLPHCLERFVEVADEHPSCGMFYCDFYAIDKNGVRTAQEQNYKSQRDRTPTVATSEVSAALFFCFGCLPGNISTVMLRREAWKNVGGFLEGIQQAPDYDMWVRVSERFDVGFITEKLMELRDHPLQLGKTGQKYLTTIREELSIFRELRRRLKPVLSEQEFMRFWRQQRGRQHAHWIAKALLRGDVKSAQRAWQDLHQYGQPKRQAAYWLLSGNGRFFAPEPKMLFDVLSKRVLRSEEGMS
jgi:glycosyltransferase involved in cell wall biosynthesis